MLGRSVKRLLPCLASTEPACLLRVSHSGYEVDIKGLQVTAVGQACLPACFTLLLEHNFHTAQGAFVQQPQR